MDAVTAESRLKRMTAWDSDPVLDQTDIDELVTIAARADSAGLAPDNAAWAGAYDLNAAAAVGWRWKMGKATSRVTVSTDGQSISRGEYLTHCQQMIREYQKRVVNYVSGYQYEEV